jgi:hypothetical protein
MAVFIVVTAWISYQSRPLFRGRLFYGDFKQWTTGRIGTGTPFMFIILLPLSYLAAGWAFRRTLGPPSARGCAACRATSPAGWTRCAGCAAPRGAGDQLCVRLAS